MLNDNKTLSGLDIEAHFHAQTNARLHEAKGPLMLTKAEGVFVEDIDGQQYLEAMSGLWYANLGFSNERLIKAAHNQLNTLPCYHTFNHRSNDKCAQLAHELASLVPMENTKIFFVGSGSEGIDTMIKSAWYYHAAKGNHTRRKIITRDGAFHGSSVFGAILGGLPHMHIGFNLPDADTALRVRSPYMYREAQAGESEEEFSDRLILEIETLIETEGAENIAAMIAEPIIGAGGVIVPPVGYFKKLSVLLKKNGILLLMDEVICAFGRTGNWFGAQTFEAQPDMIAMAKGLTCGYIPMGAVAISGEVYDAIADQTATLGVFGHGYTYSGHPTAAAVALEAVKIYKEMDAPKVAQQLGAKLKSELRELGNHPLVGDIRCEGFIAGIEIVANKQTKAAFPKEKMVGKMVEQNALRAGLIVRNMGDTIALCPPLILSDSEFGQMISKLTDAFASTHRMIVENE